MLCSLCVLDNLELNINLVVKYYKIDYKKRVDFDYDIIHKYNPRPQY